MAGRISRFLRLEKARDDKPSAKKGAPLASPGRFGDRPPASGAETTDRSDSSSPAEAVEPRSSPLDRFRGPASMHGPTRHPAESTPIADAEHPDAQPFIRCALCEADSSRYATHCQNCHAPLATADQRMFNDRLWAQRQDEAKRLEDELVALRQAGADADAIAATQRRLGEQLARDIAARERSRLSWMEDGPHADAEGIGRRETPGLRLLRLIPSTRLRLMISICLLGIGCYFAWAFFTARGLGGRVVPILFFWAMIALFVPGRRRRRWWNR